MKSILATVLITAICLYSEAQTRVYNTTGGNRILTQKSGLVITGLKTKVGTTKEAAGLAATAIIGPLIDAGISFAKEKIKQNAKKFQASFTVNGSNSAFWEDKTTINLPKLRIWKKVLLKGQLTYDLALEIVLTPKLSTDEQAFRYEVESVQCAYSGAKTKGDYDFIDFTIDVKFKSLTLVESKYELKELRAFTITIPSMKTDKTKYGVAYFTGDDAIFSAWLPLLQKPSLTLETDKTTIESTTTETTGKKEGKDLNDKVKTEVTTLKKPTSDVQKLESNSGTYEFEITVTESNPYKIKSENLDKQVESTGDSIGMLLKAIFASDDKDGEDKK